MSTVFRLAWRVSSVVMVWASCLYLPEHLQLEVPVQANTVVGLMLDSFSTRTSRSFEFKLYSQKGPGCW